MDFNMNEYTIILLAINLASTLVGNAYYFLRKKFNKTPPPTPPPPPTPAAPFASPEFVTEILERV